MAIKRKTEYQPSAVSGDSGWDDAPTEITRRVVLLDIVGDTGTGRTKLALTAPGPIAFAHAAEKIEGVLQRAAMAGNIKVHNFGGAFSGSLEDIAAQANVNWTALLSRWNGASTWAKSKIIDTASEGWELIRLARFGTLKPEGRMDNLYGPVNAEWRSLLKAHKMQDRYNLITIHQTKDEYKDRKNHKGQMVSERTGRTIRAGMKEMAFMADVIVRTGKTPEGVFTCEVIKGWYNAQSEGTIFQSPNADGVDEITFPMIMAYITETPVEEWS